MAKSKAKKKSAKKWSLGDYYAPMTGIGADYTEFHVQSIDFSGDENHMLHTGRIQVYSELEGEAERIAAEIVNLLNEKLSD